MLNTEDIGSFAEKPKVGETESVQIDAEQSGRIQSQKNYSYYRTDEKSGILKKMKAKSKKEQARARSQSHKRQKMRNKDREAQDTRMKR